jgi:hypothetical protein
MPLSEFKHRVKEFKAGIKVSMRSGLSGVAWTPLELAEDKLRGVLKRRGITVADT